MDNNSAKKTFSDLGLKMLISVILICGLQLGVIAIMNRFFPQQMENYDIAMAAAMLPLFLVGYPISFLIMKNNKDQGINAGSRELKQLKPGQILVLFVMCYGILIIGNILGLIVTAIIGAIKGSSVTNPMLEIVSNGGILSTAVYTVILAPICEEFLFRKLLIDKIVNYGEKLAILISGLMFGLFHLNFNQFFYAFFLGMFLAAVYVKTNNVKNCIILHMMVNFLGSVVGGVLLQNLDLKNTSHMIIMACYSLVVYSIAIAGIILLIVKRKTFVLSEGSEAIEKKERFKTVSLAPGMTIYIIALIIVTVWQSIFG